MRDSRRILRTLNSAACIAAVWAMSCPFAEEPKPPRPSITEVPIKKGDDDPKPETKALNTEDKKTKNEPVGEAVPLDPTQLTPAMRDALNPPATAALRDTQAHRPAPPAAPVLPPIPEVVLKAFVETEGKSPAALLEVDGKVPHLVSEGSAWTVHLAGKQSVTLIIKKVSRNGIEIEVLPHKQIIHVK